MGLKVGNHALKNDLDYVMPEWFDEFDTSHTNGIQAAIQYAYSNKKAIKFSDRVYQFTKIELWQGTRLIGSGKSKTKLEHIGTGVAIENPFPTHASNIEIADMTIVGNNSTTEVLNLRKCVMSKLDMLYIDLTQGGTKGVVYGRINANDTHSVYYNSAYDVQITGKPDRTTDCGIELSYVANSNTFVNVRTNFINVPIRIVGDMTNNNVFTGCHFEQFNIGAEIEGYANVFIGTRFEDHQSPTVAIGYKILLTSQGINYMMGSHNTGVATLIEDNGIKPSLFLEKITPSQFGLKVPYAELGDVKQSGTYRSTLNMGGWNITNSDSISLNHRTTYKAPNTGDIAFLTSAATTNGNGLYFKHPDATGWSKIMPVRSTPTSTRPATAIPGEMIFDTTLNKPIWRNKTNDGWVDANGSTV